jgi:hypothetical protein
MNNNYANVERGAQQLDALFQNHGADCDFEVPMPDDVTSLPELPDYMLEEIPIQAEEIGVPAAIEWSELKPIQSELLPVLPFTASLLPKSLADFVMDEASRMPCPPDYIAAAVVVALGSLIGAHCAVKPKKNDDSWLVTANLWGGVVGEPSAKKTPAINTAMKNMDRLESLEAKKLEDKQAIFAGEMAAYEAHKTAILSAMKRAAAGKADVTMSTSKNELTALQPPEEPYQRRFKSNDSTVEKLGDLLVTNPDGLLVLRDELIGLLASWDKEGRDGDRAFYLEAWNGTGSFNIDRIARGSLFVPNLCLSVFGGIQPDLLTRYLGNLVNSLDNDGRIQRFQVLVFPDTVTWEWRDQLPAKDSRTVMRGIFDHLATFEPVEDGAIAANEYVKLPYFCFDDAAQELFIEWSHDLNNMRIAAEENPLMRQHLAKYEKLFCSLALIFHLAAGKVGAIGHDSALLAAAYSQYLESHARRIYGLVEAAKVTAAQTLSRRLSEGKLGDGFTARDVRRKRWGGLGTAAQVESALDVLEEFGWVRGIETGGGAGGRPTINYSINPQVLAKK